QVESGPLERQRRLGRSGPKVGRGELSEERLAARAGEDRVEHLAAGRRERVAGRAQRGVTLRLVGKCPPDTRAPGDGALDPARAALDRRGVREEDRDVDAADLGEQRTQRLGNRAARDPAVRIELARTLRRKLTAGLEPGEVLDEIDPRDDARRERERDAARRRVEADELGEL